MASVVPPASGLGLRLLQLNQLGVDDRLVHAHDLVAPRIGGLYRPTPRQAYASTAVTGRRRRTNVAAGGERRERAMKMR